MKRDAKPARRSCASKGSSRNSAGFARSTRCRSTFRPASFSRCSARADAARPRCSNARRLRDARCGPHLAQRQGHRAGAAASASRQHDVPELCAVSAFERAGQYRVRTEARRHAVVRDRCARRRNARAWSSWRAWRSASPTSSPAVSGSAWRWRARWRAARNCCCLTSRLPRSTRSCAKARNSN